MDNFFSIKNCECCGGGLSTRTTSWFSEKTICGDCSKEETELKTKLLEKHGQDFEGCNIHILQLRMMVK